MSEDVSFHRIIHIRRSHYLGGKILRLPINCF